MQINRYVCQTLPPNICHARSYQNAMFSKKYLYLGIQIWPWPFNPISFASKYKNFHNNSLFGFRFGHDCLFLSLLHQKYQNFQNTSLGIQIWPRPFNPISFASKAKLFKTPLSWDSRFSRDHLILSLLHRKYQNFQNTSLLGFKVVCDKPRMYWPFVINYSIN